MTRTELKHSSPGFNIIELLTLLGVVGLLVAVAVPALLEQKMKARQIDCAGNLKQIGFALLQSPQSGPGFDPLLEIASEPIWLERPREVWRAFQVLSNELDVPGVLVCPSDVRRPATDWAVLADTNISYFIGLDATTLTPKLPVAGDHQISAGRRTKDRVLFVRSNDVVRWTTAPHPNGGNIAFADGSVRALSDASLRQSIPEIWKSQHDGLHNGTLRLALPEPVEARTSAATQPKSPPAKK